MTLLIKRGILIFVLVTLAICCGTLQGVLAVTDIGTATIAADTTWTSEGSPYIVNSITINQGATLTLEPGTIIKFRAGGRIRVNGRLKAQGTETEPIYLTSVKDDSVGGDADGVIATPQKGDWGGIHVYKGAEVTCNYSKFNYGGYYIFQYRYSLFANEGRLEIQNSELSNATDRIITTTGDVILKQTILANGGVGIAGNGAMTINNCSFNNLDTGISYYGNIAIQDCTFSKNKTPVELTDLSKTVVTEWSRNIFTENTTTGIRIASFGNDSAVLSAYGTVYYIDSALSIPAGGQVEIEPGVVVKLKNGRIQVEGSLVLKGTAENPVIFTSIKDDSVGGDTDGVIATPQKGDWGGIHVYKGAEVTCNYSKFNYGGYYIFQYRYSLFANEGRLEIQNSELSNATDRIITTTGDVILKQTILANGGVGIDGNGAVFVKVVVALLSPRAFRKQDLA